MATACHVFENELILQNILSFLPVRYLIAVERVSKKWLSISKKIQKGRHANAWFMYTGEQNADEVAACMNKISSLPRNAVVFCSSSLSETGVRVSKHHDPTKQPPRKARMAVMDIQDYITSHLPSTCKVHGICTEGVVGTSWADKVEEHEEDNVLSCLLMSDLPGVEVYGFYKERYIGDDIDMLNDSDKYITDGVVNTDALNQLTGIPEDKKLRLLLLFEVDHSGDIANLMRAFIQKYKNIAIAGAVVDSFFTETLNCMDEESVQANRGEYVLHGIAFCGNEEDIEVASVVIPSTAREPKQIDALLKRLKYTKISEKKSLGFMLACLGRGADFHQGVQNIESKLFRKHFPTTPLFGCFGNGEMGYDYLPDYSTENKDKSHQADPSGSLAMIHAYSTIFVVVSFLK